MTNEKLPPPTLWFIEKDTESCQRLYGISEVIFSNKSKYHQIDIIKTVDFGNCLVLNGHARVFELDEFIYHEALICPFLSRLPYHLNKILIAGDGDGGAVRDLLKSDRVASLTWVEIDPEVVHACRKYLKIVPEKIYLDNRLAEVNGDISEFLLNSNQIYEGIVCSVSDPTPAGPSELLYSQQFFQIVNDHLLSEGLFVIQSGCSSIHLLSGFCDTIATLKKVFPYVIPYQIGLPSFGLNWGFAIASKSIIPEPAIENIGYKTQIYDIEFDKYMITIPKYLSEAISLGHPRSDSSST